MIMMMIMIMITIIMIMMIMIMRVIIKIILPTYGSPRLGQNVGSGPQWRHPVDDGG